MLMLILAVVVVLLLLLVLKANLSQLAGGAYTPQKPLKRMSRELAFKVLDVPPTASEEEVMEAYRKLIQKLHPDQGGSAYLMDMVVQAKNALISNNNKV